MVSDEIRSRSLHGIKFIELIFTAEVLKLMCGVGVVGDDQSVTIGGDGMHWRDLSE